MKKIVFYILSLFVALVSCKDDEITTDPQYRLDYSTDTVSFDTIMGGMLSPFKTLKVYNHSGERINISSISYASTHRYFMININGKNSHEVSNMEIANGDSMYIFVQTNGECSGSELPFSLLDSISISYNGNVDYVYLSAYSETPVILDHFVVKSDTTLSSTQPYLVKDTLKVEEGVTLTIDAGVRLYFHNNASLYVDGILNCNGEVDNPVEMRYFRSDRLPNKFFDNNPQFYLAPGNWKGVYISKKSGDCRLLSTNIIGAYRCLTLDSALTDRKVIIGNSLIFNSKQGVLYTEASKVYAYNSVFANGGFYNVHLKGGNYLFNHCTIASYLSQGASGKNPALYLDNVDSLYVEINNSIVCGSNYKIAKGDTICTEMDNNGRNLKDSLNGSSFRLRIMSSIIGHESLDGDDFIDVIWGKKLNYKSLNSYLYDFSVDSLSPARTFGNDAILKMYPECATDIMGKSRVDDEFPDVGAYEY